MADEQMTREAFTPAPTTTKKAMDEVNKTIIYETHNDQHVATVILYATFMAGTGRGYLCYDEACTVCIDRDTMRKLYRSSSMIIQHNVGGDIAWLKPVMMLDYNDISVSHLMAIGGDLSGDAGIQKIWFDCADLVEESEE